jgi:hypothetical protein
MVASDLAAPTILPRAKQLVDEGNAAIAAGDTPRLRRVVNALGS